MGSPRGAELNQLTRKQEKESLSGQGQVLGQGVMGLN